MGSVSHSEADSYLLCRRKHYYGYTRSLERVKTSTSLAGGSLGHAILEAFYATCLAAGNTNELQLSAWNEALVAAEEVYVQAVKDGFTEDPKRASLYESLFEVYFLNEPYIREGFLIWAVEKKFKLCYDEVLTEDGSVDEDASSYYPFIVDLIVRTPEGNVVVVDHKFIYEFYTYEQSQMQPQIPKYVGALRGLGYRVDWGLYNMIRTRKIKAPTVEQSMRQLPVKPNPKRVQTVFEEQLAVAHEIAYRKTLDPAQVEKLAYRVANQLVCKGCSFLDICRTELVGGNTELMLATEYKVREKRVQFEVSAEAPKQLLRSGR